VKVTIGLVFLGALSVTLAAFAVKSFLTAKRQRKTPKIAKESVPKRMSLSPRL
jgi:hypothetical protein